MFLCSFYYYFIIHFYSPSNQKKPAYPPSPSPFPPFSSFFLFFSKGFPFSFYFPFLSLYLSTLHFFIPNFKYHTNLFIVLSINTLSFVSSFACNEFFSLIFAKYISHVALFLFEYFQLLYTSSLWFINLPIIDDCGIYVCVFWHNFLIFCCFL